MAKKLIIILGAGPGLGRAMSTVFAEKGFSIALLSRNAERLKQDVDLIHQTNPRCEARFYPVDVGDHIALKQVLDEVYADLGPPEVVYFNAARVQPSRIGQASPEYILDDFKSMNIGFYVAATWAIPHLTSIAEHSDTHPCFLFTNSGLWDRPIADYFSLSMQKAAQYNLANSLSQVVGPQGVHVGSVNIGGIIREEDPETNTGNIANKLWELYEQDKDHWKNEIIVGDWDAFLKMMSGQ